MNAVALLEAVNRGDVWVIQRGQRSGFTLEPRARIGVERKHVRENLDRDISTELDVACAIHIAHPAGAEKVLERVGPELTAGEPARFDCITQRAHRNIERRVAQKLAAALVVCEQRFDFAPQVASVPACVAKESVAFGIVGQRERVVVQPFNPLPSIGDVCTA